MEVNISEIVKAVAQKIQEETGGTGISASEMDSILGKIDTAKAKSSSENVRGTTGSYTYPLAKNHPDAIKSKSGKAFSEITFERVIQGKVTHEDFKTHADTLLMQAEIAEKAGKKQFAGNLRRAAELTRVPDEEVLKIYDKLRPNRATKQELLDIAANLRTKYQANITADLVEETARVYEKRNILL